MALSNDLLLIGLGRIFTALLGLLSIRFATNLLSPDQYGKLALLISAQMFCGMFLVNPVEQHIYRHAHEWWDHGTLFSRLISYKSYAIVVSTIGVVFVGFSIAYHNIEEAFFLGLAMFVMVLGATGNGITVPMLNMLGFRAESVFWSVLTACLSVLFSVILVFSFGTAISWFAGQAIGMVIVAMGASISIRRKSVAENHKMESSMLIDKNIVFSYCIPLAISAGLMWLLLSGYRFAVEYFWGLDALGYIAAGFILTSQVWGIFEYLSTQLFYPAFYRKITDSDTANNEIVMSDLLNVLGPMSLILLGVSVLVVPALHYLLIGQQYYSSVIFIYFGVLIEFCRVLSNFFSRAAHITRHTRSLALPYSVGCGAQFIFLFIAGWQRADLIWVGYGLFVGVFCMLVIMANNMYKEVHYKLDCRSWFMAIFVLIIFVIVEFLLPEFSEKWQALSVFGMGGFSGACLVYFFVWKSFAVKRILLANLR